MKRFKFADLFFLMLLVMLPAVSYSAQSNTSIETKSQEISDLDGVPVIIKHLPEWETARNSATLITDANELRNALGERPILQSVDFIAGTEAVTAPYPQGKLLIVEYSTPQASVDTDNKVQQALAAAPPNPPVFYRRIGNYNVFLFDGTDEAAANALFDQIKYEKTVQWLGEDPNFLKKAERALVQGTADVVLSTFAVIVLGLGFAIFTGIAVGLFFFRFREQKRATMKEYSDAGGMIRLNLDELTPEIAANRLLND